MLKLYRRIICYSVAVAWGTLTLSILFEFAISNFLYGISKYLSNVMIGIFCSTLVVILTTYLQYKSEQSNLLNLLSTKTRQLVFRYSLAEIQLEENENVSGQYYSEQIDNLSVFLKEVNDITTELCFCQKKYNDLLERIIRSILKCRIVIHSDITVNPQEAINDFIKKTKNEIVIVCKNMLLMNVHEYDKKEFQRYIDENGDNR